jgi:hypothetical protein
MGRDIASMLIRRSVRAAVGDEPQCARCRRIPLVGEWIYQLGSGARVCSLCVEPVAATEGAPVGAERIRSCERPLAVRQQRAA